MEGSAYSEELSWRGRLICYGVTVTRTSEEFPLTMSEWRNRGAVLSVCLKYVLCKKNVPSECFLMIQVQKKCSKRVQNGFHRTYSERRTITPNRKFVARARDLVMLHERHLQIANVNSFFVRTEFYSYNASIGAL